MSTSSSPAVATPSDSANPPDWRDQFQFYEAATGDCCDVCGSSDTIGLEPRFGYPSCEGCKDVPPVKRKAMSLLPR